MAKRGIKQSKPSAGTIVAAVASAGGRRRPNLTIRVNADLYAQLQQAAGASGRSLSEEVERRLERAAEWERVFESVDAFKAKFAADRKELEYGDAEAALYRRNYGKVIDPRYGGHVWVPPGRHSLPQAEWVDTRTDNLTTPSRQPSTIDPQMIEVINRAVQAAIKATTKRGDEK